MEYEELLTKYKKLQNAVFRIESKLDEMRELKEKWRYEYHSIKKQLHNAQMNTVDIHELERLRVQNSKLIVELNYLKRKHRIKETNN